MPQLLASFVVFLGTLYFLGEPNSAGDLIIEKIAYFKAALVFLLVLFALNFLFITPMRLIRERQNQLDAISISAGLVDTNLNSSQEISGIPKMLLLELGNAETHIRGYYSFNEIDRHKLESLAYSINEPRIHDFLSRLFDALDYRELIQNNYRSMGDESIISVNRDISSLDTYNQAYNYYFQESLYWCWLVKQHILGHKELDQYKGFDFRISRFSFTEGEPIQITWMKNDNT